MVSAVSFAAENNKEGCISQKSLGQSDFSSNFSTYPTLLNAPTLPPCLAFLPSHITHWQFPEQQAEPEKPTPGCMAVWVYPISRRLFGEVFSPSLH